MPNSQNPQAIKNDSANGSENLETFVSKIKNIDLKNASLDSLTDSLKSIFNCEAATLYTYDSSTKELYTQNFRSQSLEEIRFKISTNNLAGYVAATGKPLNIFDVHSSDELKKYHKELKYDDSWDKKTDFHARSSMLIPLPHKSKLVGVLEIVNKNDNAPFHDSDFIRAKAIALVMGLALVKLKERNHGNQKTFPKEINQEENLSKITQTIRSVKSSDEIFLELKNPLLNLFQVSDVIIFAIDPKKNELYSKIDSNAFVEEIHLSINHSSFAGFVAEETKPLNIKDVNDPNELKINH
jgi:transcriptional regulator with GAF, ATPase, and Fis domain